MAIDYDALDAATITFPTKKIPVPELKYFFPDEEEPIWEVKSLTGAELAIANEASELMDKKLAMVQALAGKSKAAMKKAMETFLSHDEDTFTPEDLARRHKILEFGSVPRCPEHICVKLAHAKPTLAWKLTNEILRLTGDGADLGK